MVILNGIAIILGILLFIGIVWWAYSGAQKKDNEEAAQLPFSLENESELNLHDSKERGRHE